jgi:hypothetical protein
MFRVLMLPMALLLVSAMPALATDTAPQGGPSGALGYECDDDTGQCTCSFDNAPHDCEDMLDREGCEARDEVGYPWDPVRKGNGLPWYYFVDCDRNTGTCTCNRAVTGGDQSTSRRPETFDPANENASEGADEGHEMLVPPRRDADTHTTHRSSATVNAPRSDDIVAPNNRTTDRQNETVSARRGNAPTSDTATDEAAEADEDAAPTERRVRDHRQ